MFKSRSQDIASTLKKQMNIMEIVLSLHIMWLEKLRFYRPQTEKLRGQIKIAWLFFKGSSMLYIKVKTKNATTY